MNSADLLERLRARFADHLFTAFSGSDSCASSPTSVAIATAEFVLTTSQLETPSGMTGRGGRLPGERAAARNYDPDCDGVNVAAFTGPSHTVTESTEALSAETAAESSSQNHSAMFSAEGLISVKGGISLTQV